MRIREASESDFPEIEQLHLLAFGEEEGPEIVELVRNLLDDETAKPLLFLVAVDESGKTVGYILFTRAEIVSNQEASPVPVQLLAPLAVHPGQQGRGVGQLLIEEGLRKLKDEGVGLVLVLGHPDYYPRSGFQPAGVLGLDPPYPILEKNQGAWMARELAPGVIGRVKGKLKCAEALDKPEYWRE